MKFLAPQVIQTALTDCGPAALQCLLNGTGVPCHYAQLREACQTDVEGTSIDMLEDVSAQLGRPLEQVMLPHDHVCLPEASALPSLVVTSQPGGATHFVVLWRRVGPFVQVMDPATGRRWLRADSFKRELYSHGLLLSAADWLEWARSEDGSAPLRRRLGELGMSRKEAMARLAAAADWRGYAALDAAVRVVATVIAVRGLRRGREATRALDLLCAAAAEDPTRIPPRYWSVTEQIADTPTLLWRGAVLLRLPRAAPAADSQGASPPMDDAFAVKRPAAGVLGALASAPQRPLRELLQLVRGERLRLPSVLMLALLCVAAAPVLEALAFRGVLYVHERVPLGLPRLAAFAAVLAPVAFAFCLEFPIHQGLAKLGRSLELRMRLAYLSKLPRLGARYFRSRLVSDVAERAHALYHVRRLPELGARFFRATCALLLTTLALAWLDARAGAVALAMVSLSIVVPLALQPMLSERDLRKRTYEGALMRFYLDALRGAIPTRCHAASDALASEHEALLVDWTRAGRASLRAAVAIDVVIALFGVVCCVTVVGFDLRGGAASARTALLAFWALQLPTLSSELVATLRLYPVARNAILRMLELLQAPDEHPAPRALPERPARAAGVALAFQRVSLAINRRTILHEIDSQIAPGMHVAIVGASGAGKSSIMSLLLGWQRASAGSVSVDGVPLGAGELAQLRADTVWIDPSVQLWNESLLDNLGYGAAADAHASLARVLDDAELHEVLQSMPAGLQSSLGEGGGLVSGGEGQRVRVARALLRRPPRLVILDEALRGLDKAKRRRLLAGIRARFQGATLLCITHDLEETRDFDRVWVMEHGRLVEDATPEALSRDPGSRYCVLQQAELQLAREAWSAPDFRQLRLVAGRIEEREHV